jgi:hypothetical protein
MPERPYARYTREKTWSALHSQAINACYALVPYSATNNSIWLMRCETPEETQATMARLLSYQSEIEAFFARRQTPDKKPPSLKGAGEAVVLARSSDYWRYNLSERPGIALVVCGIHDSYLHIPVLEMRSNRRYAARETAISLNQFKLVKGSQERHNIIVAALAAGDKAALAFLATLPERTQRRLRQDALILQHEHYRGRPLAFHTESERQAIGAKISAGLILYHARKKAI